MKLNQLIDVVTGYIFNKYFGIFAVLGPKSRSFINLQTYRN